MASRGRPPSRGGISFGGRGDRGGRGGGGFGGRGGSRGGFQSYGPPDTLIELGTFKHAAEGDMVYVSSESRVPKFNSSIYLASKSEIGKCDEIFGTVRDPCFTVKPGSGIIATSFKTGDKVFVGSDRILPKNISGGARRNAAKEQGDAGSSQNRNQIQASQSPNDPKEQVERTEVDEVDEEVREDLEGEVAGVDAVRQEVVEEVVGSVAEEVIGEVEVVGGALAQARIVAQQEVEDLLEDAGDHLKKNVIGYNVGNVHDKHGDQAVMAF